VPLIIGVSLALAVGVLYTIFRLDRDRAFYPTVTIVIASYYALFAIMGASTHTLVLELLAGAVFLLAAVYGFRTSSGLWRLRWQHMESSISFTARSFPIPACRPGGRSSASRTM